MPVPLIRPAPPKLSRATRQLRQIEASGTFSNFGPVNTRFEQDMVERLFGGAGACMTTCNATIGLMLAVQQAIGDRPRGRTRFALMPSFTFAATAHAALWCGLTPLLCDIDPVTWTPDRFEEERLLDRYGDDIAVVMPYATFGYPIDLGHYETIAARRGVPVVVDAAASLGTVCVNGRGFGSGFSGAIVFSMHATKSFSAGEGGLIYSGNPERIAQLRQMANFGFGQPRTATMPGLNAKLSEVGALLGQLRLDEFRASLTRRGRMMRAYRAALPQLNFQPCPLGASQAYQFASALLPRTLAPFRPELLARLGERGIGTAAYFSPHLAQQPYFARNAVADSLMVTDDIAGRMISLPLFDAMTRRDIAEVTGAVGEVLTRQIMALAPRPVATRPLGPLAGADLPALPAAAIAAGARLDTTA